MDAVPDGEWFCPECEADPGAPVSLDGATFLDSAHVLSEFQK